MDQTRIVRNSVGSVIEVQPAGNNASAVLPGMDFSPEQAALAGLSMPFRKVIRDPLRFDVSPLAATVVIDRAAIIAAKCTSFHVVNPNDFYVRLRGAASLDDKIAEGEGWLWPPGFVGVYSTQYPSFISTIAVARPGVPIGATRVPLELAYGIGG